MKFSNSFVDPFYDDNLTSTNPRFLYRGMKFFTNQNMDYAFDQDIPMPTVLTTDENGMKCVMDGNEYGIYMSSNPEVGTFYATPNFHDASTIGKPIQLGMDRKTIGLPAVGILMRVNTQNVSIKEPKMGIMKSLYNNNMPGKEWIATQNIPIANVMYQKIIIGPDLLHDAKVYDEVSPSLAKQMIDKELKIRESRLTKLHDFLKDEPSKKLLRINFMSMRESFKKLFVEDVLTKKEFTLDSKSDLHDIMLCGVYQQNGNITLSDIIKINFKLNMIKDEDVKNRTQTVENILSSYMPQLQNETVYEKE